MTTNQPFTFGMAAPNTAAPAAPVQGGIGTTPAPFTFGSWSQPQAQAQPGLNLTSTAPTAPATTQQQLFTFGGTSSFTNPATSIPSSQAPLQLNPSQGQPTQPPAYNFTSQPSFSSPVGGGLGGTTSLPLGGFSSFGTPSGGAPMASAGLGAPQQPITSAAALSTNTLTTPSNTVNISSMNFRQLKELLNKWTSSLDEEEKHFIQQATRGNYWDTTLMNNGDKITKINESIVKVKNDHANMENAMDVVKANQRDLEIILNALEESLPANIIVEPEREHLYNMSVDINMQLQQMTEDLKEVIRHLNDSNRSLDRHDPVGHILKIMNEHTDTLQWMEDNAAQVKVALEDVSKMNQAFRRDHERNMRIMFKY